MPEEILYGESRGHKFKFVSTKDAKILIDDVFNDCYKVLETNIPFQPGDVVLDFGACEGMFSVMMAKTFPFIRVHAYEPVPRTYATLLQNIELNKLTDIITPHMIGLGKGVGKITINVSKDHAGGSTSLCDYNPTHHDQVEVDVLPFDTIMNQFHNSTVRLVKMDIEGMEFDVLYASDLLCRTEYFCGELHMNHRLEYQARRMDALATWVSRQTKVTSFELCAMAE